jgi:hypothetical protein
MKRKRIGRVIKDIVLNIFIKRKKNKNKNKNKNNILF